MVTRLTGRVLPGSEEAVALLLAELNETTKASQPGPTKKQQPQARRKTVMTVEMACKRLGRRKRRHKLPIPPKPKVAVMSEKLRDLLELEVLIGSGFSTGWSP